MKWFLIFFGLMEITISIFITFTILINTQSLYSGIGENPVEFTLAYIYFCALFLIGLIQLIRGLFFKNSSEKNSKYLFYVGVALLILLIPVMIRLIIYPIYGLMDFYG